MGATLTLDKMPKSCSECFKDNKYNLLCNKTLTRCDIDIYFNKRHPDCPLQDTTELLEYVDLMYNGTPIEKRLARHKLRKALGGSKNV